MDNLVKISIQEIKTWEVYAERPEGQDLSQRELIDHYTQRLYENGGVGELLGEASKADYSVSLVNFDRAHPQTSIFLTSDLTEKAALGVEFSEAIRVCTTTTDDRVEYVIPNGKRMVGSYGIVRFYDRDGNHVDLTAEDFTSKEWFHIIYGTGRTKFIDGVNIHRNPRTGFLK